MAVIAAEQEREREERQLREELNQTFGVLPEHETGEPTPQGAQAPEAVLQEPMEEAPGDDDEAVLPRQARGSTPINVDLAKMHVTTPERPTKLTSPVPVVTLAPVLEQAAQEEVPTAALPEKEQVAPERAEMGEAEAEAVVAEPPPLDVAELLYGHREEDLTEEQQDAYRRQKERWDEQEKVDRQKEHDELIALQMQASEQQRVDRPIQLGPERTVPPPTAEEVAHAGQAFGAVNLDDEVVAVTGWKEERRAKEAYQPPLCDICAFKPSTGAMEQLAPTPEEEAQMAKRALKPQAFVVELVRHSTDEDEEGDEERRRLRDDALLAHQLSIQVERDADGDYERARKE